jgi:peptidoglycan/xylan/chitin deacetylase (PgdA/CDA1 family)
MVVVITCGVAAVSAESLPPPERTLALTFDDATRGDGPYFSGTERTKRLIEALSLAGVDEAMFFVTTNNVAKAGQGGAERLQAYTNAGHSLANHSHSHQWLSRVETETYIADLDQAIERLAAFDNVAPYYRFPFLDEGRAIDKRDALRSALQERALKNGYVTIDTYDWYLVSLTQEARKAGIEFRIDNLRELYVDVITRSAEFYDSMARRTLGRSPHHVLLLHENDLAAMFIGDLVTELRNRGFRIIPASLAFSDPIAEREPDTLFLGQGRIAALAHEAGWEPADLVSPTEDEAYLRRRYNAEVVALPNP